MTESTPPGNQEDLPFDPDVDVEERPTGAPRPLHLRLSAVALVFAGGTLGTAAREALTLAFPPAGGVPYVILAVNLAGALFLGVLLEALTRRGPDHGVRRTLRLLFGTGALGGFTTYSALATDTASLLSDGLPVAGLGYGLGTVLIGAVATWAGLALATATHRPTGEVTR